MSKKLIAVILISSTFASFFAYVFYQTFYKYQSDVDQILAEIPAEDKELPPNILKVFRNTRGVNNISHFTTTNLRISANEKRGRISNGEWHLFGVVWSVLLPLRIGEKEEFGFYANQVYCGKHKESDEIIGFRQAAKFYFKKDLQDLNEDELLVLMVFSNSPEYARNINSEMFRKKLNDFTETYYRNSAKFSW